MFTTLARIAAVAMFLLGAQVGMAFPDKPLRIIVPFSAGSITDVLGRELARSMEPAIKQTVIVENRTGAEGVIGARAVIAESDGHTIMLASSSLTVIDALLKKSPAFDPAKSFIPICAVGRIPFVMNISAALPYREAKEFMTAARAQPGKFTYGYSSANTRLAGELFQQVAGVKLMGVPYKSTVGGLTDVAGGQVDLFFIDPVSAGPHYQSGRIRPVLVSAPGRLKALPDVPTATEAGLRGFEIQPWFGLFVSSNTNAAAVDQLRKVAAQALKSPGMLGLFEKTGLEEFTICGDELGKHQESDAARMAKVIKDAGIQPE